MLGGVGGMSGECEACGRGLLLCVRLFGLVLCVRGWQRRFLFLGEVIVGVCIGAAGGGRGGSAGSVRDGGGMWVWLMRFRFRCLCLCCFRGVDGLGWSVLVGSCVGCRCDSRGRMGMVVVWCGRMCVMWEAGVVVRVDQREA